jgi:DNA repair protein RadC
MGSIKEMPMLDRPREKAMRYGVENLSDSELLAALISTGYQGYSSLDLANNLITKYNGLHHLSKLSIQEISTNKGIKETKAINLVVAFELHKRLLLKEIELEEEEVTPDYLYNKYREKLINSHQENLILIILGYNRKLLHEKTLYIGTEKNVLYSYKDIWRELFIHNGKSFYLIHNHPNNKIEPSKEDRIITSELFFESKRMKIPMIDHLIIGENGYYSFQTLKK